MAPVAEIRKKKKGRAAAKASPAAAAPKKSAEPGLIRLAAANDIADAAKPAAKAKPKARSKPASKAKARPAASSARTTSAAVLRKAARPPARPTGSAAGKAATRIFQIYFEPWQRDLLDRDFIPFDNSGVKNGLFEFDVFERLAAGKQTDGAAMWGALSWRYGEKTGLTGRALLDVIAANPGTDVFFCNPHPHNEALYHNLWMQGETAHPRFLEVCEAVFKAAKIPVAELSKLMPSSAFSAANYFVGSPRFWALYLPFVRSIVDAADRGLDPSMRRLLHSTGADARGLHGGSTYVPFIVERLFPLFLRTAGKELKAYKVPLPARETEFNVHLKLLREMRDVAHSTKSPWLAACWVNYRSLYFLQTHGREWCQKYLAAVTPTKVAFC
ncbi:MAG: hypothetical protein INF91_05485 [Alphaproteobacteria bacterium]|nr:hypothetical protein [Alphaproteobacteria bacterium]